MRIAQGRQITIAESKFAANREVLEIENPDAVLCGTVQVLRQQKWARLLEATVRNLSRESRKYLLQQCTICDGVVDQLDSLPPQKVPGNPCQVERTKNTFTLIRALASTAIL
jgi:hypothetical protein